MCYLYLYNIFGLQNKVLDLLLRCQNVSHVAFRNMLYYHLTSNPKLTGKLKLSTFSCSYFFPYSEHVFMFIMSYWTALRLRAGENITKCQNWDKLDRGHGKGAIMGYFAVPTVFSIRVTFHYGSTVSGKLKVILFINTYLNICQTMYFEFIMLCSPWL